MYDVMIIGRDLSSLITALALACRGLKTILVNEGKLEIEHREAGYAFPIDPMPLSGFGVNQTISRLIQELQLANDITPTTLHLDTPLQVIFADHRIDLFHDRERLLNDIVREFPQQEREIGRFYHAVFKADAFIERWIGEDQAAPLPDSRKFFRELLRLPAAIAMRSLLILRGKENEGKFRKVIEAQLHYLTHLDTLHRPFPLSSAYLLTLPQRGLYYPFGRIAWMNFLYKAFTDAGGILMDGCSVMRIDTHPEIIVDVESSGTSTTLRSTKLVVSVQWEKIKLLLLHQKVFRRLARKLDSFRPMLYPFCLHLGVYEEGLPESLAPYAIVIGDERKPATGPNLVYIATSRPGETEHAPEGKRAMIATVFLKDSPLILGDSELKGIANTIIDTIEYFLPFLRESIDFVQIEKSIAFSRSSQEIISQKYRPRKGTIVGMAALTPKTPMNNVLITGGILRAGLGFEGEILAGLDAAYMIGKEIRYHGR